MKKALLIAIPIILIMATIPVAVKLHEAKRIKMIKTATIRAVETERRRIEHERMDKIRYEGQIAIERTCEERGHIWEKYINERSGRFSTMLVETDSISYMLSYLQKEYNEKCRRCGQTKQIVPDTTIIWRKEE